MEFLSHSEILAEKGPISDELERLLADAALVTKPSAKQWSFVRACWASVVSEGSGLAVQLDASKQQIAQYRYEAMRALEHYYRRHGKPVPYAFQILHERSLARFNWDAGDYPDYRGYRLLVRRSGGPVSSPGELLEFAESLVGRGIEAEFKAYALLPQRDDDLLSEYFVADGPAWRRIVHVLDGCGARGWTLREPRHNPSTFRLLSASAAVERVDSSTSELRVRTTEYWYLRWWDARTERYAYPYRETNHQLYYLKETGAGWRIEDNSYPAPRTTAPHRRRRD